jgi:hypothetical protein
MNGADKPLGKMPDFVRNVPIKKAPDADTILAYEMNGEPLPALHGFPLRAIVPGWEGAYSVKWLTDIQVIEKEYDGFFVKTAYRFPNRPVAPGEAVAPQDMIPLTGLVVKSFINSPLDGATVAPGKVRMNGFAWAGESNIAKVDVSMDNGSSWFPAKLGKERERYAWQSFEYEFNITQPGSYLLRLLFVLMLAQSSAQAPFLRSYLLLVALGSEAVVRLMKTPNGGVQPQAMMDERGRLHLIYFAGEPFAGDIYYHRREPGKETFSRQSMSTASRAAP